MPSTSSIGQGRPRNPMPYPLCPLAGLSRQEGCPWWLSSKEPACDEEDAGDTAGLISGLRRSPAGGLGKPLQYSCLDNPMNKPAWRASVHSIAENQAWLKQLSTSRQEISWNLRVADSQHRWVTLDVQQGSLGGFWYSSLLLSAQALLSHRLCDPMDCSPPGSSVHGILQARILEWVAIPSSRGSSWPRDQTHISWLSCIAGGFSTTEPPGKPQSCWTDPFNTICKILRTTCVTDDMDVIVEVILTTANLDAALTTGDDDSTCLWWVNCLILQQPCKAGTTSISLYAKGNGLLRGG